MDKISKLFLATPTDLAIRYRHMVVKLRCGEVDVGLIIYLSEAEHLPVTQI